MTAAEMAATHKKWQNVFIFPVCRPPGVHRAMTPSNAENAAELHDSISGLMQDHKA